MVVDQRVVEMVWILGYVSRPWGLLSPPPSVLKYLRRLKLINNGTIPPSLDHFFLHCNTNYCIDYFFSPQQGIRFGGSVSAHFLRFFRAGPWEGGVSADVWR